MFSIFQIQGMPFSCKKKDVKEFFRPLVPFTIRIPRCIGKVTRGFCYVGFRSEEEKKKALFKNKSFLGKHSYLMYIHNAHHSSTRIYIASLDLTSFTIVYSLQSCSSSTHSIQFFFSFHWVMIAGVLSTGIYSTRLAHYIYVFGAQITLQWSHALLDFLLVAHFNSV